MIVVNDDHTFTNAITGQVFDGPDALQQALDYADIMKIADYREITPAGIPLRNEGDWTG